MPCWHGKVLLISRMLAFPYSLFKLYRNPLKS